MGQRLGARRRSSVVDGGWDRSDADVDELPQAERHVLLLGPLVAERDRLAPVGEGVHVDLPAVVGSHVGDRRAGVNRPHAEQHEAP